MENIFNELGIFYEEHKIKKKILSLKQNNNTNN